MPAQPTVRVAILDDNFAVRQSLKILVHRVIDNAGWQPSIYSAADGVEGIGYALVTVPNIIIVDTTLPKYSGREVIEYLRTNNKFLDQHIKVIVITDGDKNNKDAKDNFKYLSKQDPDFLQRLEQYLQRGMVSTSNGVATKNKMVFNKFFGKFLQRLINFGAKADVWKRRTGRAYFLPLKFIYWLIWMMVQFVISVMLFGVYLFIARPGEVNETQARQDENSFKMRVYPLTIISITVGWFMLMQLLAFLFVWGSV